MPASIAWQGLSPDAAVERAIREDAGALLASVDLAAAELSLLLCDDPTIHGLNTIWRGVDRPTDVLSFPQDDPVVLGDLVVSLDTAARQAAERRYDRRDEVRVLLVHGLLHLLGYDHERGGEDAAEMVDAERRLLTRLAWRGRGLIEATITPENS